MEMPELSSNEATKAPEEQTLAQAATEQESHAAETDIDPEAQAEAEMTEAIEEQQADEAPATKASLLERAKALLEKDPDELYRDEITRLRQQFGAIRKIEIEADRAKWAEEGNAPEDFVVAADPEEAAFNETITAIRDKKNARAAEVEEARRKNLEQKNSIIEQIIALAEDTDNVNRTFQQYIDLQAAFNALGEVPPTEETSVWKRFQEARERYSDNLKINKELRDYDFKKNLEQKLLLIDDATALADDEDIITAFRRLQELHDKWRQIGPVAKELRDDIWARFKDASAVINKKYQAFFEERKEREAKNEAAKTALCEQIEALDFSALSSFTAWDQMTTQIIALQNEWKTLGYASRKVNNALFARFRQRCDDFFTAKAAYFKAVKEEYAANLARKTALAEEAEALKDSTEWRKTTDRLVEMQKEWKTIGAVPKKHSDAVWKRFQEACDYFFEQKKQATSGQRAEEQANLKAKREIIDALAAITDATPDDEALASLRRLQEAWQQTGHVPFREKDKINDAYRTLTSQLRRRLNLNETRARMDRFETSIKELEGDNAKLYRERDRLVRALEGRRADIRTYENNIGFLTSKSKTGESMLREFNQKIERLRDDIRQIEEKIRIIDSSIANEKK